MKDTIKKAFEQRIAAGADENLPKDFSGEPGPITTSGIKNQWPFVAVLEYTCDCNPDPRIEWYRTTDSTKKSGKYRYNPDKPFADPLGPPTPAPPLPADLEDNKESSESGNEGTWDEIAKMIEQLRAFGVTHNGGRPSPRPGSPPGTQGQNPQPKWCYLVVADTPTETASGHSSGFVLIGHVTWTIYGWCPGIIEQRHCQDMATLSMKGLKGDGKPRSKVKDDFNETDVDEFYKSGGFAPPA